MMATHKLEKSEAVFSVAGIVGDYVKSKQMSKKVKYIKEQTMQYSCVLMN